MISRGIDQAVAKGDDRFGSRIGLNRGSDVRVEGVCSKIARQAAVKPPGTDSRRAEGDQEAFRRILDRDGGEPSREGDEVPE